MGKAALMSQFHFDRRTYLRMMRSEVPDYEHLQDSLARRVLAVHPHARLVTLDENPGMLERIRPSLGDAAA